MNAAGHSKSDMSQEYTLVDLSAQERVIRAFQAEFWALSPRFKRLLKTPKIRQNKTICMKLYVKICWEKPVNSLEELGLNGGLEKIRTFDLFRVKEAL